MIKLYYYTFKEILDQVTENDNKPYSSKTLQQFCTDLNVNITQYKYDIAHDPKIAELWTELFAWLHNHPIIRKETCLPFETPTITNEEVFEWLAKFLTTLAHTYPYYSTLLDEYNTAKDNLMSGVKSINKSKTAFNDTPQNPNTEAIYEGDGYISTFTKNTNEAESDFNTKMARLKELQDYYKSIMADWIKEFERLFYEEV